MSNISDIKNQALPEAEKDSGTSLQDTTPKKDENEIVIPVKFNKEVRNLNIQQAGELAQKGLKFESIANDFAALKAIAAREGKSVPEFIGELQRRISEERLDSLTEKCGGDKEMARHILNLEEKALPAGNGFDEVKKNFPEIKTLNDLPREVVENSELKGTLLLNEYLRYLLAQKRAASDAANRQKAAEKSSTGSLINRNLAADPETDEFLRGLWK